MITELKIAGIIVLAAATAVGGSFCSTTPAKQQPHTKKRPRHTKQVRETAPTPTPFPSAHPVYLSTTDSYVISPDGSWTWIPSYRAESVKHPSPTPKERASF